MNESHAYGLEDIVLKAVEDMGMDFWWIDWQQGGQVAGCTGDKQNPTIWYDADVLPVSLGSWRTQDGSSPRHRPSASWREHPRHCACSLGRPWHAPVRVLMLHWLITDAVQIPGRVQR